MWRVELVLGAKKGQEQRIGDRTIATENEALD